MKLYKLRNIILLLIVLLLTFFGFDMSVNIVNLITVQI